MITRVRVKHFKRFDDEEFKLSEHVVLAGPNNSGKTTLLQGIAVWNLALRRWAAERGDMTASRAKTRIGVPVTRKDFTALPLREMKLLWTDTLTALKRDDVVGGGPKPGYPRVMSITVEGTTQSGPWELTFEFRYQNSEMLYVKPPVEQVDSVPRIAEEFSVVHVPPFSGIGPQEIGYDAPYQDLLIGQGKAGDILRNLLLQVSADRQGAWGHLCDEIRGIFGCELLPPVYEGPYILSEYAPINQGDGRHGGRPLDISNAGSGFHQVLQLLGFFFARPATVMLLDEPDAHLHVILQKEMYDRLRRIAALRACQLIIATHSEVLIDGTSPDRILSFYGRPHRLVDSVERDQVREALKRLTPMDILAAEEKQGVLYVENETDFNLLRAWARVLGHPVHDWFARTPFWHANQGSHPREARAHYFALRAIRPELQGYLLLDGDNRGLPDHEIGGDGLVIGRWKRYEAESYLIHPDALFRFVEKAAEGGPLFASGGLQYLKDELPGAVLRDPCGDHDYLNRTPASKTLLPGFFQAAQVPLRKKEYYQVAEQMQPEEIAREVREKLGDIARTFGVRT